jgi:hypothetical protein
MVSLSVQFKLCLNGQEQCFSIKLFISPNTLNWIYDCLPWKMLLFIFGIIYPRKTLSLHLLNCLHYNHIQRAYVWGCLTYVLDPRFQDGKKIPKWDPRSQTGMFVGASHTHSSNIGRIQDYPCITA